MIQNIETNAKPNPDAAKIKVLPVIAAKYPPASDPIGMATTVILLWTELIRPSMLLGITVCMTALKITFVPPIGTQAIPYNTMPAYVHGRIAASTQQTDPIKNAAMEKWPRRNFPIQLANKAPISPPVDMAAR